MLIKEIILKKYKDVRLNTIERNLQGEEAIAYLEYVSRELGDVILIERLKIAGYFVTDRNKIGFNKKNKKKIEKWIKVNCSNEAKRKFYKYSKDGKLLSNKKSTIEKKIKQYIKKYNINILELLEYINNIVLYNTSYCGNSEKLQDQLIILNENIISITGILLQYGSLKVDNKKNNIISNEKYMQLMQIMHIYNVFNDIIRNWIFGEVNVEYKYFNALYIDEKYGTISDRMVSMYVYISLNSIKVTKKLLEDIDNLSLIDVYKKSLQDKVAEFFYTNDFQEKFIGITLEEWIKLYLFFYEFVYDKDKIIKIDKQQLIKLLEKKFNKHTISVALEAFTFSDKSNDLFSSFLIEQKEYYLIMPSVIKVMEPLKSMMSLFTKHMNGGINEKGYSFEKSIRNILSSVSPKAYIVSNLQTHHNGEGYELDVLMYLDNTLFVFECKTQFQHEDVRGYYRNVLEVEYYLSKFRRNFEYFAKEKSGQDSINNKFKKKIPDFNIKDVKVVPIFVSNISYRFVKKDDIYVLDDSRIYNFFKKKPPVIHYMDNYSKKIYIIGLLPSEFFNGNITDDDFIYYLENCKKYEIDINNAIRKKEVNINKYGIKAVRLMYDGDYLKEMIKEYIAGNSMFK